MNFSLRHLLKIFLEIKIKILFLYFQTTKQFMLPKWKKLATLRNEDAVGRRRDRKWLFQFRIKSARAWRFLPLSRTRPEEIWRRLENVSI